jgi:hypothetical protein
MTPAGKFAAAVALAACFAPAHAQSVRAQCATQAVPHRLPECRTRAICGPVCPVRGRPYPQAGTPGELYIVCLGEQRVIKVTGLQPGALTSDARRGELLYTPSRCR